MVNCLDICYTNVMRSHISATIDETVLEQAKSYSLAENRTLSNVIEQALKQFLSGEKRSQQVITSKSSFKGSFSREDSYDRR